VVIYLLQDAVLNNLFNRLNRCWKCLLTMEYIT